MALPLPYRPPAVVALKQDEEKQEKRESLKLVISKPSIFMSAMKVWYSKLTKKEKSVLTKKKLIHRAVLEAFKLKLPFERLPKNWIQTLRKDCGLQLFVWKSTLEKRKREHRDPKKRKTFKMADEADSSCDDEKALKYVGAIKTTTKEDLARSNGVPSTRKKIIDLTGRRAPDWWLKAFHQEKIVHPRVLKFYTTSEATYMYYAYKKSEELKFVDESLNGQKFVNYRFKGDFPMTTFEGPEYLQFGKKILELAKERQVKISELEFEQQYSATRVVNEMTRKERKKYADVLELDESSSEDDSSEEQVVEDKATTSRKSRTGGLVAVGTAVAGNGGSDTVEAAKTAAAAEVALDTAAVGISVPEEAPVDTAPPVTAECQREAPLDTAAVVTTECKAPVDMDTTAVVFTAKSIDEPPADAAAAADPESDDDFDVLDIHADGNIELDYEWDM